MNNAYDLQPLVLELLKSVPEVTSEYERMKAESEEAKQFWKEEDYAELDKITAMHGLPKTDYSKPGVTIVFEDLLLRFMLELIEDKKQLFRLKAIMDWIEQLANHQEFAVRNLIAGSICEPLITTHESTLPHFVPLMGEKTKALCTMQFEIYRVSAETKKLFGVK